MDMPQEIPKKPAKKTAKPVGDVNSTAKGSGARYNEGKTPYELIPLTILAELCRKRGSSGRALEALKILGDFQVCQAEWSSLVDAISLLDTDNMAGTANVFDFGRGKYAEWNWAKGMPWSVPIACCARHLVKILEGEVLDSDSGLPHADHAICNLVMLITYTSVYPEGDDRTTYLTNL